MFRSVRLLVLLNVAAFFAIAALGGLGGLFAAANKKPRSALPSAATTRRRASAPATSSSAAASSVRHPRAAPLTALHVSVENKGQVLCDSALGRHIERYASDARYTRYLEVGTFDGQGSTCCFYGGFLQRADVREGAGVGPELDSLEVYGPRAAEAALRWDEARPLVNVHHARVLNDSALPTFEDVVRVHGHNLDGSAHNEDTANALLAPAFVLRDPQVLLLDGGEYVRVLERAAPVRMRVCGRLLPSVALCLVRRRRLSARSSRHSAHSFGRAAKSTVLTTRLSPLALIPFCCTHIRR